MTNMTKCKMETIVNYNAGEQAATVCTRAKAVMRKRDQYVKSYRKNYKLMKQTDIDKTCSMPKAYICYRKSRTLNVEQRVGKEIDFKSSSLWNEVKINI